MSTEVVIPIKQYAKTAAQLATDNFVHVNRQLVIASDTGVFKLGDGVTAYNSLPALFTSSSAWGGITGTLSSQTDLQAALNLKANLTSASFSGAISASNLSGTNTGDSAVNSLYSGLASSKQDTLVSATNIKTINGSSILGSGNLSVTDSTKLPLAGGTLTGSLLFTDNTYDIGASGATRPRSLYIGTLITTPNLTLSGGGLEKIQMTNNCFISNSYGELEIRSRGGSGGYSGLLFNAQDNYNSTSGTQYGLANIASLAFSAGSASFDVQKTQYTINNGGAQSGTVTGLKIVATETNLNGIAHDLINATVGGSSKFKVNNSGAISIGNTVNTVSPTSPNRTVTIVINGTTYYLAAKTTND